MPLRRRPSARTSYGGYALGLLAPCEIPSLLGLRLGSDNRDRYLNVIRGSRFKF